MSTTKIRKPDAALSEDLQHNKFKFKSSECTDSFTKIVLVNESKSNKTLRLKIMASMPESFHGKDTLKDIRVTDFEVIKINRYMGFITFICKSVSLINDGKSLTLEI